MSNDNKNDFQIQLDKLKDNIYTLDVKYSNLMLQIEVKFDKLEEKLKKLIELEKKFDKFKKLEEKLDKLIELEKINYNIDFFNKIDNEKKAYYLGLILASSKITKNNIYIINNYLNLSNLEDLKNILNDKLIINRKNDVIELNIDSQIIVNIICKHLNITFKNNEIIKDKVIFPKFDEEFLNWSFIRGLLDGNSYLELYNNLYPICSIISEYKNILDNIKEISKVPCTTYNNRLEWKSINVIDFLHKLYNDASIYNEFKYNSYKELRNWKPKLSKTFKYVLSDKLAIKPSKNRDSDAGIDLHLIRKIKEENNVIYYDTGIKIKPEYGYYCELVGRSSIAKTGHMLANNIGIIDANYNGNIIVALIKINPNVPDLNLPIKLVQLIPRESINIDIIQVDDIENTLRNDDGGLGSKHIK